MIPFSGLGRRVLLARPALASASCCATPLIRYETALTTIEVRINSHGTVVGARVLSASGGANALVEAACLAVVPKGALERVPVAVAVES